MPEHRSTAAAGRIAPLPPQFRARAFTDARGRQRFGISLSLNGSRFNGSVLMRNDRIDAGGVAELLESLAAFVRRG
jgi:hypothetical protein